MQAEIQLTITILLTGAILLMGIIYDDRLFGLSINQTQYCHDHFSNLTVICHNPGGNIAVNIDDILIK